MQTSNDIVLSFLKAMQAGDFSGGEDQSCALPVCSRGVPLMVIASFKSWDSLHSGSGASRPREKRPRRFGCLFQLCP